MHPKAQVVLKASVGALLLAGACMLLYPAVSEMHNARENARITASYEEAAGTADTDALIDAADSFNKRLFALPNQWAMPTDMKEDYREILDVSGTGVIGNVLIPKIGVSLPIYHGTGESVLSTAIGHMEGTSFPVGGKSTHAVLSGHTGMASADLFNDLDKLETGDTFLIIVLGRQLVYEVKDINVVLPDEMEYLKVEKGADKATLLTCTPKGVNSHRLLVTGVRKVGEQNEEVKTQKPKGNFVFAVVGFLMMAAGTVFLFLEKRKVR